ncbi:transposase [Empedobacter falsenii]|uniref:transposase n=1 Tax=Empedobacter falsenii TaxID=343874 RepID=UPI002577C343|nr:transposase [Empedobacter falsenii]MDM1297274.1 transposase [Empedobacter falsenii]MDM1317067.1 transposase [Empedobacter falsenii]
MNDLSKIHIGKLIKTRVENKNIDTERIINFFKCTDTDILKMFDSESLDCELLLKWSKLLKYDFFRIYSQHLILFSPPESINNNSKERIDKNKSMPEFRKNLYTKEIIDFVLQQINLGEMTKKQVIERYQIPKTTLYKWIYKYKNKP